MTVTNVKVTAEDGKVKSKSVLGVKATVIDTNRACYSYSEVTIVRKRCQSDSFKSQKVSIRC